MNTDTMRGKYNKWTRPAIAELKALWPRADLTTEDIALRMGRSVDSVKWMARHQGCKRPGRWALTRPQEFHRHERAEA